MSPAEVIIHVRNVGKAFTPAPGGRAVLAVDSASLAVPRGDLVGIVGPSGCGKSTLLNMIAGLDLPTAGEIVLEDRPVTGPREIGYVFQGDTLLPWRNALRNAEFALEIKGVRPKQRRQTATAWLDKLGLGAFHGHFPHQLSGGMRKRLQLATILAAEPSVLLMDEPFGALDAQTRALIEDDFVKLWSERGITAVFVTHDLAEAIAMCTRVVIMTARPGRIKAEYDIDLPRGVSTVERRLHADFQGYFSKIWDDLRHEVGTSLAG